MNSDRSKKGTFTGLDWGIKLLELLPDHAFVYFHNLSYDIRMFAKFELKDTLIKGSKTLSTKIKYGEVYFMMIMEIWRLDLS